MALQVNGQSDPAKSDPLSGDGWRALSPSGGATRTWATGPARLVCDVSPGTAGRCGIEQDGYLLSPEWYEAACRVRVTAGDGASTARFSLGTGRSATDEVTLALWANGTLEAGYTVGGRFTSLAVVAGPEARARTEGHLWLRITRTPVALAWSWGVDATATGALPTVWTTLHVSSSGAALAASGGRYVAIVHQTLSALRFTAELLALRVSPRSPGAL